MELAPLLSVRPGVTALIGAGGKTTLMLTLGRELSRLGKVLLCTTTKIFPPEEIPVLRSPTLDELREALAMYRFVCAGTLLPNGKLTAPDLDFSMLPGLADYILVEADGAHRLPIKAHAAYEPVIPPLADQTILVVGASAFGRPIRETCHRPERFAALAEAEPDSIVTPCLASRVLRAEGLGDRVFVNQTDLPGAPVLAAELAALLPVPVVAGSLNRGEYQCLS